MNPQPSLMSRAALWLSFAAAASIVISIAAFNILAGLALAALLLSGEKLRFPPIKLPLGIFILLTFVAWFASADPLGHGYPQIRKFWDFLVLLLIFSTLRSVALIRSLFLAWAGLSAIGALRGFVQFATKVQQAHQAGVDFYTYYVSDRITGFMSHWNTYSAQQMIALVMLAALLFFSARMRQRWVWVLCAALMAMALYLGETRAVWLGSALAGLYLLWCWRRWMMLLVPLAALLAYVASPHALRERFTSFLHPSNLDSNGFRVIARNAGIQMIERHPLLGIGPEGPKYHFEEYVPKDVWATRPDGFYQHLHNLYLQYGAERGIPALLVFLWLIGKMLLDFWRGLRSLPPGPSDTRSLLHGAIAVILAILAEGFAEVNLGDSEVLIMFLTVIACAYLALDIKPSPEKIPTPAQNIGK
jgi:putative inorganic carbon (hco3(-)) transporter